jgi:hypothetical protein
LRVFGERQAGTELRLAARAFGEHHQLPCHAQRRGATEIRFDERPAPGRYKR